MNRYTPRVTLLVLKIAVKPGQREHTPVLKQIPVPGVYARKRYNSSANMIEGSVIIVSYNSNRCIAPCLHALRASPRWKLILVDNASTDSTVETARRAVPTICVVQNTENRGFAAAVNQGFRLAEGEACLVLNPDTIAQDRSLEILAQALAADQVGAVAGALTTADGTPEKGFTVRRFPTVATMVAEVLLLNRLWPANSWNRSYRCLDMDYAQSQEVEQPAGACLVVKRQAWEQVGGFDESFFPIWFEDVDFCRRLHQRAWKILYSPEARFTHSGGHSVHQLSFSERQSIWYRNLLHYFAKHHSAVELLALRVAVAGGLLLRSLLSVLGFRPAGVSAREAVSAYLATAWRHAILAKYLHWNAKNRTVTPAAT